MNTNTVSLVPALLEKYPDITLQTWVVMDALYVEKRDGVCII